MNESEDIFYMPNTDFKVRIMATNRKNCAHDQYVGVLLYPKSDKKKYNCENSLFIYKLVFTLKKKLFMLQRRYWDFFFFQSEILFFKMQGCVVT